MSRPFFFGYGSLVNIHTHTYGETSTAELQGWRRVWQMTPLRPHPFLSIEPHESSTIQGLIAHVPDGDWAQLDAREYGYDRLSTDHVKHARDDDPEVAIYVVPKPAPSLELGKGPILLSYLDVVIQGFLKEFGESGVRAFFDTTAGWDHPVDNDREAPKYPRHQRLTPHETALVDAELKRLGIEV
ncbi:gamma-glutamylcyclotransferase family protein [Cognatishimia sp.]|uniref:gamma-glutamylcyclotransferase family protein n=1 Tax=Cognatishimia sp. TaxID=2211648 RepID=UPI003513C827|nr:gamma-glutamylcyclotransferase [Cognatishimia sp.]